MRLSTTKLFQQSHAIRLFYLPPNVRIRDMYSDYGQTWRGQVPEQLNARPTLTRQCLYIRRWLSPIVCLSYIHSD